MILPPRWAISCDQRRSLYFILAIIHGLLAITPICRELQLGDACRSDEECSGPSTVCRRGVCTCLNGYEAFAVNDKLKICRPAPANVHERCQSYCKPPLVCSNNKCICWKARQIGNTCVVDCPAGEKLVGQECVRFSRLREQCDRDADCEAAFSFCKNGHCACRPGTFRRGDTCVATCPDGTPATQVCRKTVVMDKDYSAYSQSTDTCPTGYHCVTYGKPLVGHCCRLYCPYGSPDTTKSCDAAAPIHARCPLLTTHFCHNFESYGVSTKLCCPRPCREPTPFYFRGECLPLARFHDPCLTDGQCEGGTGMRCLNGRCECEPGFQSVNYTFPSCVKRCPLHNKPIMSMCFEKSRLDEPCFSDSICPRKARCREGRCECDCNFARRANTCINPEDPLNIDSFLSGFQKIFGGANRKQG